MSWKLHLLLYIASCLALFYASGFFVVKQNLIDISIILLPLPVVIFHIAMNRLRVTCIVPACDGFMRMSSTGSLSYTCTKCGAQQTTCIRRSPQNRG